MSVEREFWHRREGWEPVPRKKLSVVVALAGLLLGGVAFAAVPRGGSRPAAHRAAHAAVAPYPVNVSPAPAEILPVVAQVPVPEVPALPVVALAPAPVVPVPAHLPTRASAGPSGATGATTTPQQAPPPPERPPAPPAAQPPAQPTSCVLALAGVCVQTPSLP